MIAKSVVVVSYVGSPNITGSFKLSAGSSDTSTGAFTDYGTDSRKSTDAIGGRTPTAKEFDASRSSSLFGKTTTLQPSSVLLLVCIKT